MFAPNITVAACASVIIPAFTKPITMTLVALELCIAAVVTVPTHTPKSLLLDAFANRLLSRLLPSASRLELIMEQAIRNIPMPATSVSIAVAICVAFINTSPYFRIIVLGGRVDIPMRDVLKKSKETLTDMIGKSLEN